MNPDADDRSACLEGSGFGRACGRTPLGVILVQGRRKLDWVDEVRREAGAVQAVLEAELATMGVSVTPIICVHRAELPILGASVAGIPIVSGRDLVRRLRKEKRVLDAVTVSRLAQLADERLKPAAAARATPSEPVPARK